MGENDFDTNPQPAENADAQSGSGSPNKKPFYMRAFDRAERGLCYIGLRLMRRLRFIRRRAVRAARALCALLMGIKQRIVYMLKLFLVRNGISFEFLREMLVGLKRGGEVSKKRGTGPYILYWLAVTAAFILRIAMKLLGSLSYIAPIVAAGVFIFVVNSTLEDTYALKVTYKGEDIGYIADESVFERAEKQMLGRIVFEDYVPPDEGVVQFKVESVDLDKLLGEDELTDELIKTSGNELSQATGLYVDEKFMGAVENRQQLITLLNAVKDRQRSKHEEDEIESSDERVEFVKEVEPKDGLYPVASVVDISEMSRLVNSEVEAERIYTAVKGDAPIIIAQKNGVPYSQLKALNPTIEEKLLIGQEVLVKKAVPFLEVKVVRTETVEEEINFKIEQIRDPDRFQGYVNVTQRGKKGAALVTSEVTYIDGLEVDRTILSTTVITEPINEKVVVGGKFPQQQLPSYSFSTSGSFIWPTQAGRVSCGFYGYWGHTGMDIAAPTGTPIYASAAGIVTKAAYNTTGYGYHIIINHGGGTSTLYGHNSKLHVKVGDTVKQGQLIASMGSTGRSSGPHCHFEIRINGKYMNPANYIGTRCPY